MFCKESLDELTIWHREQHLMAQTYWAAGLRGEVENSISKGYNLCEGMALRVVVAKELVGNGGNDEEEGRERVDFWDEKDVNEQQW